MALRCNNIFYKQLFGGIKAYLPEKRQSERCKIYPL